VSQVIQQFQLNIPLRSLFETPTIADMATVITAHQGKTLDERGMTKLIDELDALSGDEAKRLVGTQRNESTDK
jgi:hypothetical protein